MLTFEIILLALLAYINSLDFSFVSESDIKGQSSYLGKISPSYSTYRKNNLKKKESLQEKMTFFLKTQGFLFTK